MLVKHLIHEREVIAKDALQAFGAVSCDWKAAALFRSVGTKRSDDDRSSRRDGGPERGYIGLLLLGLDQKVKGRPVVPHVILPSRHPGRNVGDDPFDVLRCNPLARTLQCDLG